MDVQVVAQRRVTAGKNEARRLRQQEMIPAVFYGPGSQTMPLTIPLIRMEKLFREMGEEQKLLNLIIEDGQTRAEKHVMLREIQTHPARRQLLHVDFYEVAMDQAIEVNVPVELKGKPVGVVKGGSLNLLARFLEVRCLPGEIPEKVEIDVSALEIGQTLHVADLVSVVPYELVDDGGLPVATIEAPEGGTEEAAPEAAAAAAAPGKKK
ncbi:MAG TPA: 50S ribosomal protein L25 [Syntrophobacteraceae bacterium]|nr:50S ribosomal protein L25 [Syntrophobacteraceae bacterium]HBZ56772.1 50S ribosomal protein L25 [Syntrophobacteraceae bacterium]